MQRQDIIDAIKNTASENGGAALGQKQLERVTGISTSIWRGKFWTRWSDAVREAGFSPNRLNEAHGRDFLLESLAILARERGGFPTYAEVRMARENDKNFPAHQALQRLGNRMQRIDLLRTFAKSDPRFHDVLDLLPPPGHSEAAADDTASEIAKATEGFVYMVKFGKDYKISVPRRHREIALELPEKPNLVHAIRTDDPEGIENYWHTRFDAKRRGGEWFALSLEDVRAFKRRKFM